MNTFQWFRSFAFECLLIVYRNLGFQLGPLDIENLGSLLHCAWNVTLNLLVLERVFLGDPFLLTTDKLQYDGKPLIRATYYFNGHVNLPLSFTLTTGYFFYYGHQIVTHLQAEPLSSISVFRVSPRLTVTAIVLCFNSYFIIGWHSLWERYIHEHSFDLEFIFNWTCLYLLYLHSLVPLGTVLYIQLALSRCIAQTSSQLDSLSHDCLVRRLQECATVARKLNRLASFPFAVFIFTQVFDSISFSCLFGTDGEYGMFVYVTFMNALLYSCAITASLSEQQFKGILKRARARKAQIHLRCDDKLLQSAAIQISELSIYSEDFHLKISHLCTVNKAFMGQYFLFVLGYTVLLLQTN